MPRIAECLLYARSKTTNIPCRFFQKTGTSFFDHARTTAHFQDEGRVLSTLLRFASNAPSLSTRFLA